VIELVDTHAHLQEPEFARDVDEVIERAVAAGIVAIIVPAVDAESARRGVSLARRFDGVFATAGCHPHEAARLDAAALDGIEALLREPRIVAVGEIGLDFYRMHSPRQAQIDVFEGMLALAERHSRPVVVHCRDAWDELGHHLLPWARKVQGAFAGKPLGVLHYFSGSKDEALRYLDLGFLVSVHTSVTHPKSAPLREVVATLPLEGLVVETDSPYGAPQAFRGKRNEPAYVVEAAKLVGELKGVGFERAAAVMTENARRLFQLPIRARIAAVETQG